jgi:glycosyltransferase involved in cell wall biosynthesis
VAERFAIYNPTAQFGLKTNMFGKDVANLELFRALARHGGFAELDILGLRQAREDDLVQGLFQGRSAATKVNPGLIFNQAQAAAAGSLLRGQPDLYNLAWLRRRTGGDSAYSLMGLVHTLAPPAMRRIIADASIAPTQAWDAIICTSPAVKQGLEQMFAGWEAHLAERTGGRAPPRPALPVIPLGVDGPRLAALADRPDARARVRQRLGLAEADVLVLWVGRLSFYEKAFPQAMFQAVRQAAEQTGLSIHFALAGWFPHESDRPRFEAAAQRHAGLAPAHFLDGNDHALLGELWAGADVFLSLVDNIQETFGITPIEAMAAGLPVVVSDWDGYRFTVRDSVEGFLVPTLGGPVSGLGGGMVQRHVMEAVSYQAYVGEVAQYTAVHVGRAAAAIAELARSPELRRRMGEAGRARVAEFVDWPVVARQYAALADELAELRRAAPTPASPQRTDPVRGDPFVDFAGFASQVFALSTPIRAVAGASGQTVREIPADSLDNGFPGLRASLDECAQALDLLAGGQAATARDVLLAFPVERRRLVETGLVWMAKLGLIDWLD